jgi:hypothetical protein
LMELLYIPEIEGIGIHFKYAPYVQLRVGGSGGGATEVLLDTLSTSTKLCSTHAN